MAKGLITLALALALALARPLVSREGQKRKRPFALQTLREIYV